MGEVVGTQSVGRVVRGLLAVVAVVMVSAIGQTGAGALSPIQPKPYPLPQEISNIPTSAVVGGSFTPIVSTTSDGATSVTSETPTVCSVDGSGVVAFIASGLCTLRSHVAESATFASPPDISQQFTIAKAAPSFPSISNVPPFGNNKLAVGSSHSCTVLSDSTVKCWGHGDYQLVIADAPPVSTSYYFPVTPSFPLGVTAIALGGADSCALLTDGTVRCWLLGIDSPSQAVSGLSGVSAIAAGGEHVCAVVAAGAVKCWGANGSGQLGDGTPVDYTSTPVSVSGLSGVIAIAAGGAHSCAVVAGGSVKCWGSNSHGQLGDGSTTYSSTPVSVSGLSGAVAVSASGDQTCVLLAGGSLKCWGANGSGQLGDGSTADRLTPVSVSGLTGVIAVSAAGTYSCAVLMGGSVKCWGANGSGQLGDNTTTDRLTPVSVSGLSGSVSIATGDSHSCASVSDGSVKCWGANGSRQLGDNTTTDRLTPVTVFGVSPVAVWSAGVGGSFTPIVSTTGDGARSVTSSTTGVCTVGTFGVVSFLKLGTCTLVARVAASSSYKAREGVAQSFMIKGTPTAVTQISAGSGSGCVLIAGGTVKCWGNNSYGQLGDDSLTSRLTPVSVKELTRDFSLKDLSGVSSISVGDGYACALLTGGTVKCWGKNSSGQLGDGSSTNRLTPVLVKDLSGVFAISTGQKHACALLTVGTVKCWGFNLSGQLGDGSTGYRLTPVLVKDLSGVAAISAGGSQSCALLSVGTVKCWGFNLSGQLGDGSTTNRLTPVSVKAVSGTGSLSGVSAISAGGSQTCAALNGGSAVCWGNNHSGQLGDGSKADRSRPVPVKDLSGVAAISAGGDHTCAELTGGAVKCWGSNASGQVGNGSTTDRSKPVSVQNLSGATAISSGHAQTCALLSDSTVKCWGSNYSGELGNDSRTNSSTPVSVVGLSAVIITNIPETVAIGTWYVPRVATTGDGAKTVTTSSPNVCKLESNGRVYFTEVGTCTLVAHVAAGANFNARDGGPQIFKIVSRSALSGS